MTEPSPDLERELQSVVRRIRRLEESREQATAQRDGLIRAAIQAGVPRHRIIALTELSPARVDQIRRGARL